MAYHNATKTHCKRGHDLSLARIETSYAKGGAGLARKCRLCKQLRERERRAERGARMVMYGTIVVEICTLLARPT